MPNPRERGETKPGGCRARLYRTRSPTHGLVVYYLVLDGDGRLDFIRKPEANHGAQRLEGIGVAAGGEPRESDRPVAPIIRPASAGTAAGGSCE
jgi:hypothetical protein